MQKLSLVDVLILIIIILGIMLYSVVSCYINMRETYKNNIKGDCLQSEYL